MTAKRQPPATGYEVGYKRPPSQHRFQKGVSGNPKGRPKKAIGEPGRTTAHAELDDILIQEALRPITIRENDELIQLPMIQAVLRSLGVAAVKGHHRSQLALASMVKQVQSARFQDRLDLFKSAVEYKDRWREAFEEADRRGLPRPDPVPHPEEMIIDLKSMDVKFNGPSTDDEKAEWDHMLKMKASWEEEVAYCKAQLKRPGRYKEFIEDELHHGEKIVRTIGAVIPDEHTRRQPGFDLQKWRERQPGFAEVMAAKRRRKAQTK